MVFAGWRRAERSPTSEHYYASQIQIDKDVADPKTDLQIYSAVNVGLHFVQHQPTIFSSIYEIDK